jgi:hypothetical protein
MITSILSVDPSFAIMVCIPEHIVENLPLLSFHTSQLLESELLLNVLLIEDCGFTGAPHHRHTTVGDTHLSASCTSVQKFGRKLHAAHIVHASTSDSEKNASIRDRCGSR